MSIKRTTTKTKTDQQKLTVEKKKWLQVWQEGFRPHPASLRFESIQPELSQAKTHYISNTNSVLWTSTHVFAVPHKVSMIILPNIGFKINFSGKRKKLIVQEIKKFGFLHTNTLYLIDWSLKNWKFQLKLLYKWDNKVLVLYGLLLFNERYKPISLH